MTPIQTEKHEFKHCPFCDAKDTLIMEQVVRTKIKGSKIVKGIFDCWKCSQCGEEFFYHWDFVTIETDKA